jgi:hypothetical protein
MKLVSILHNVVSPKIYKISLVENGPLLDFTETNPTQQNEVILYKDKKFKKIKISDCNSLTVVKVSVFLEEVKLLSKCKRLMDLIEVKTPQLLHTKILKLVTENGLSKKDNPTLFDALSEITEARAIIEYQNELYVSTRLNESTIVFESNDGYAHFVEYKENEELDKQLTEENPIKVKEIGNYKILEIFNLNEIRTMASSRFVSLIQDDDSIKQLEETGKKLIKEYPDLLI